MHNSLPSLLPLGASYFSPGIALSQSFFGGLPDGIDVCPRIPIPRPGPMPDKPAQPYVYHIQEKCYGMKDEFLNPAFKNNGEFYEQAIKDAIAIADAAKNWPDDEKTVEASRKYIGEAATLDPHVGPIRINLDRIARWPELKSAGNSMPRGIRLQCTYTEGSLMDGRSIEDICGELPEDEKGLVSCFVPDEFKEARGPVEGITRDGVKYWSEAGTGEVICCPQGPFWRQPSTDEVATWLEADPLRKANLRWGQTAGGTLVHQLLQTREITEWGWGGGRVHITDKSMHSDQTPRMPRIYDPNLVAQAAQHYGAEVTATNADSLTQFSQALYWQQRFGVFPDRKGARNDSTLSCIESSSGRPAFTLCRAKVKIRTFCSNLQNFVLKEYPGKRYVAHGAATRYNGVMWVTAHFDDNCPGNTEARINLFECEELLMLTLSGCNTDTADKKYGGRVDDGCIIWEVVSESDFGGPPCVRYKEGG